MRSACAMMMGLLLVPILNVSADAAVTGADLEVLLRSSGGGAVPIIVTFQKTVDPLAFHETGRARLRASLLRALKRSANGVPAEVRRLAEAHGGTDLISLWAGHGLALSADSALIRALAALPAIESIRRDAIVRVFPDPHGRRATLPVRNGLPLARKPRLDPVRLRQDAASTRSEGVRPHTMTQPVSTATPEWNLTAVKGPDLWALGITGQGVVVASLDTGVDGDHPDLVAQYRGGVNSWYDPHGEHAIPADLDGHGTHAMSLAVGRSSGGTAIGMAPEAQWIAAKLFNDAGFSRESVLHQSLQWVLDPDGDSETDDAPDVVNLSWAVATTNVCSRVFQYELNVLKASGIAVVMAAGNAGPDVSTSISPANNPGHVSVGSVDSRLTASSFSSQGPSACDGGVFPSLMAPGEEVRAADLSFGALPNYATVSGTSFAAPHVSGAMALLMSAMPTAPLAVVESALKASAVPLGPREDSVPRGPGLIDTLAAYRAALIGSGSGGAMDHESTRAGGDATSFRQEVLR